MKTSVIGILVTAVAYVSAYPAAGASSECSPAYGQCGGIYWTGATCCVSGWECVPQANNPYYSQCLPASNAGSSKAATTKATTTKAKTTTKATTTKTKTTTKATTTSKATTTAKATTTTKATTTKATTTTTKTTTTAAAATPSNSSKGYSVISGGASGSGSTTRYWDCCKASCGWNGKASVSSPVGSCAADGVTLVSVDAQSGCNGGSAYMCNDNQPWAVSDDLAYGFAAASIAGSNEAGWCCGCYELTFTSGAVSGKKMVVQVTNTGGDLGANHFDLQMPGGGVGIFNGCSTQWNSPTDGWGQRYGGLSEASGCSNLPKQLQAGCEWRFNWFKNADNPTMTFKEVTCPAELTAKTGCKRN